MPSFCSWNVYWLHVLTLFRLSTLLWLGSCTHGMLACLLLSTKRKQSLSNHGLCSFNSCRHRLSLVEVLIFSLMFSQALFMSSLSLKFYKAADMFEISIWYCFLTSSSFSFLRLSLSPSNFYAACLLTGNLSLTLQPPDSDRYHGHLSRPNIITKKKKRENTHTDRCGNTRGQKYCAKGSIKAAETQ